MFPSACSLSFILFIASLLPPFFFHTFSSCLWLSLTLCLFLIFRLSLCVSSPNPSLVYSNGCSFSVAILSPHFSCPSLWPVFSSLHNSLFLPLFISSYLSILSVPGLIFLPVSHLVFSPLNHLSLSSCGSYSSVCLSLSLPISVIFSTSTSVPLSLSLPVPPPIISRSICQRLSICLSLGEE